MIDDAIVIEIAGLPGGIGLAETELEALEIAEGDSSIEIRIAEYADAYQHGGGIDRLSGKSTGLIAGEVEQAGRFGDSDAER